MPAINRCILYTIDPENLLTEGSLISNDFSLCILTFRNWRKEISTLNVTANIAENRKISGQQLDLPGYKIYTSFLLIAILNFMASSRTRRTQILLHARRYFMYNVSDYYGNSYSY